MRKATLRSLGSVLRLLRRDAGATVGEPISCRQSTSCAVTACSLQAEAAMSRKQAELLDSVHQLQLHGAQVRDGSSEAATHRWACVVSAMLGGTRRL